MTNPLDHRLSSTIPTMSTFTCDDLTIAIGSSEAKFAVVLDGKRDGEGRWIVLGTIGIGNEQVRYLILLFPLLLFVVTCQKYAYTITGDNEIHAKAYFFAQQPGSTDTEKIAELMIIGTYVEHITSDSHGHLWPYYHGK